MVKVRKFQGYVPPKDIVAKLISPPYDVLDTKEARAIAGDNPACFLRVSKAELEFPDSVNPYSKEVYERARDNMAKFVKQGYLKKDPVARVYIYGQKMGSHTQYGIVALSNIDDYENGIIKKHELTRKDKEEDRTKIVDIQNGNSGPVFLTYKHKATIDALVDDIVHTQEPYSRVTCADGVEHVLWLVDEVTSDFVIHEFAKIPFTYIADGHHRAASAFNVGKMRKDKALAEGKKLTGEEDFFYFMTILYPDNNLQIMDYNRVLKELCGVKETDLMKKLETAYKIEEIKGSDPKPKAKGNHSMYFQKKWYSLTIKPELVPVGDPIKSLDVELLAKHVLDGIFGIKELRSDKRIDFVGGIRGLKELERRCTVDCVVAFAMYPVQVSEVMSVADAKMIMPPKSTWFEPKPRSGFVVRLFEGCY